MPLAKVYQIISTFTYLAYCIYIKHLIWKISLPIICHNYVPISVRRVGWLTKSSVSYQSEIKKVQIIAYQLFQNV